MKEAFVTRLPNRPGVFLEVCRIIAENSGNIARINYNKGIDVNTVFIEVSAEPEALARIREAFGAAGYLPQRAPDQEVVLVDMELPDGVGAVLPVLQVISRHHVNISFVSYQQTASPIQQIRMGLFLDRAGLLDELLTELAPLCRASVRDYEVTDRSLDGSVFYVTFAHELQELLSLDAESTEKILVQSNRIMQMLDEGNDSYLKAFDYIYRFAKFVVDHKGDAFDAAVSVHELAPDLTLYRIDPPCGSNIYILDCEGERLFFDCGFACYKEEMLAILTGLFPDFDEKPKNIVLTHADIDHSGLLEIFDTVRLARSCYENFEDEHLGVPNFREQNAMHEPYCIISKILTGYRPPDLSKCVILGAKQDDRLLSRIGQFHFGKWDFDVYEGTGGHVRGETVIACPALKFVFTGDIFVNIKEFSPDQREFNSLAPYLMTSVDEDGAVARQTRSLLLEKFGGYTLCPGHGPVVPGKA